MLQADGNWNVSRLSELLDQAVVPHVLGVLPPSFDASCDTVAWRHTPTRAFSVATAYEGILCTSWDACDPKWSCIWSLPIAQRVRMFLWLVLRQHLMADVERVRRVLSPDPSCSSCGYYNEMILHILCDYHPMRSFWKSIIPQVDHDCFFGASLDHWIVKNIKTSRALGHNAPLWSSLFPSFLWQVWKQRNDFVFNGECLPLSDIYRIGVVSPFNAELWRILMGLHLALSMGVSPVQVQSDSFVAIHLILDPMAASSTSSLVRRISSLQNLPWSLRFLWVPREMNMVAAGLSKLPSLNDFQLQIFDDIPKSIRPLLARDREGVSYCRRR
ncbi:hypothetical protein V6N11_017716 [Hibiscus sabdariffa]|uniref:Reverse transcriptase zinc-binding domain-containing protein n=1 Tax=Hibiscus sabdariffa TaxID=183260 RepID=A0ABR2TZG5_9ROSI